MNKALTTGITGQDGCPLKERIGDWAAYLQSPYDMAAIESLRKNMKTGKLCGPWNS